MRHLATLAAALVLAATAHAQNPRQVGPWTVYQFTDKLTGASHATVTSSSEEAYRGIHGDDVRAQLEFQWVNGKLEVFGVQNNSFVSPNSIDYWHGRHKTNVTLKIDDGKAQSIAWGVLADNDFIYPEDDFFQHKYNEIWRKKLLGAHTLMFRWMDSAGLETVTFDVSSLKEAADAALTPSAPYVSMAPPASHPEREKVRDDLNRAFGTSGTAYLENDERDLVINISDPSQSVDALIATLKSEPRLAPAFAKLGIERVVVNKGSAERREFVPGS